MNRNRLLRFASRTKSSGAKVPGGGWIVISEIAFLLLALHGGRAVVVDRAIAALGKPAVGGFENDLRHGRGSAFDRAGQRITAERAKPDGPQLRRFAGDKRQPLV